MTRPFTPQPGLPARRLPALALACAIGAVSPVTAALVPAVVLPPSSITPAAAAPAVGACPPKFGATAGSELLTLHVPDVTPSGAATPGPALHIGSTHAGLAGGTIHAAAEGRSMDTRAYQNAPPPHERPVTVTTPGLVTGSVRLGTGDLSAHATWRDAQRCRPDGPHASAQATLTRADVLISGDRALMSATALKTTATVEVLTRHQRPAASSTATAGVTSLRLFAGSPSEISIKVLNQPTLRVVVGRTKSVEYTAPVVEVTVPGRPPTRLAGPAGHLDLAVPIQPSDANLAGDLAREERIPVLPDVSLGDLLGEPQAAKTVAAKTVAGGAAEHGGGAAGHVAVVRLSLGKLQQETTSTGMYAKAASLRLKVLIRSRWAGHVDGGSGYSGGRDSADTNNLPVLDLNLCVLEAAAAAPKGAVPTYGGGGGHSGGGGGYGGSGHATPSSSPSGHPTSTAPSGGTGSGAGTSPSRDAGPSGGQLGGGTLPVTGGRVHLITGAGILLVLVGWLLMALARRRQLA